MAPSPEDMDRRALDHEYRSAHGQYSVRYDMAAANLDAKHQQGLTSDQMAALREAGVRNLPAQQQRFILGFLYGWIPPLFRALRSRSHKQAGEMKAKR